MNIIEVNSKKDKKDFIQIACSIYKNEKNWIRPLDKDINSVFDPKTNKAFRKGDVKRWILKNNNENDEIELLRLLDEDSATGLDGFDDGGLVDLEYDTGLELFGLSRTLGDTLNYGEGYRVRYGRRILNRDRTVDFSIEGDTALGIINYNLNGTFVVQLRDTSTMDVIDSRFPLKLSNSPGFSLKIPFSLSNDG